ncbi:MAG: hypothetical protein AAF889_07205 [Cyanobacteria bacterium P01_D01_bin.73]
MDTNFEYDRQKRAQGNGQKQPRKQPQGQLRHGLSKRNSWAIAGLLAVGLVGCGGASVDTSELDVVVNGEAFAQEGMLSKDGWQIEFKEIVVAVGKVAASGVPPRTANSDDILEASWPAEGTDGASDSAAGKFVTVALQNGPKSLGAQTVAVGNYNQVKWQWGDGSGAAIALQGKATKGDRTIEFDLEFPGAFEVACGDYVGDERKGIVTSESAGEVELTLHLDHLFGDGNSAADAEVNAKALGFGPFAEDAAEEDKVAMNPASFTGWGTPEVRQLLDKGLSSMPHVGEGHCEVQEVQSGG